jgi:hypothetical protein
MRYRRLFVLVVAGVSTMIDACVGDAPDTGITPTDDAGSSADATSTDSPSGTDAAGPIADGASDDANDDAHPFDAGPPAWTATLAAGTVSILGSAGDASCAFDLVAVQIPAGGPPVWQVYLRKQDATAGMCNEPKGIRSLGNGYSAPTGSLIRPQGTQRLVLAYSSKIGLSGSSPIQLRMSQVDWPSGNDIHVALMKTKAVVGIPATPSLGVTQLFFGDPTEEAAGTVRLKGTGAFPGESGAGSFFFATYVGFIKAVDQLPVAADTCTRSD